MELTQSRIQKIWLPNDNRPALPRRCEYGHRSIPEGWDWDGGMGWVGSTPLSLRTPAGLFAAPSQHPCSIPPPFSRCPSILPVPASCPHPTRCHPVTHSQRSAAGGRCSRHMAPRSAGCGEVLGHAWPSFHSPLPALGLKGEGAGCSPRTRVPAQLGFSRCQAARSGIC